MEERGFVALFVAVAIGGVLAIVFYIHSHGQFEDRCHKAGGHVVDQYKSDSLCFIDGKLAFSE